MESATRLLDQSDALRRAGDLGPATQRVHEALLLLADGSQPALQALAVVRLGYLQFLQGHRDRARALADEALSLAPVPSGYPSISEAWLLLGNCAAETGSFGDAEECFNRALDAIRETGNLHMRFQALHGLSIGAYLPRGQFHLVISTESESLQIARQLGLSAVLWWPLVGIAWAYWVTGRLAEAQAALAELDRAMLPGSTGWGHRDLLLGHLACEERAFADGLAAFTRARSAADAAGTPDLIVLARLALSRCYRLAGDAAAAVQWAADGLAAAVRAGYGHFQGKALIDRGRAHAAGGDLDDALADYQSAAAILEPLEAHYDLALCDLLTAATLAHMGRPEAEPAWAKAVREILAGGYEFLIDQERTLVYPLLAAHASTRDALRLLERLQSMPAPPLRIWALGDFRVEQGARPVSRRALRGRRAGELLMLLLLSPNHALSIEQAAEALIPERDSASAQVVVYHATSALRRALEPDLPDKFPSRYLEVNNEVIALRLPPNSWVDFVAFEDACRRGEWSKALDLYRGEWLPQYRYMDWALPMHEHLIQRFMEALLGSAEAGLRAGDDRATLRDCQRILEVEPWHEAATLLGMRACLHLGQPHTGINLYLALERALRDDFAARPQPETRALYQSLVAQQ